MNITDSYGFRTFLCSSNTCAQEGCPPQEGRPLGHAPQSGQRNQDAARFDVKSVGMGWRFIDFMPVKLLVYVIQDAKVAGKQTLSLVMREFTDLSLSKSLMA